MNIRATRTDDLPQILALYQRVAAKPGGIARLGYEVDEAYIQDFFRKASMDGVELVVTNDADEIIAEIHAYSSGMYCFSHVLSNLTVVVDPALQGNGLGRLIFGAFLKQISTARPDILRVELIARESNQNAIAFYESLGFSIEGEFRSRIRNVDGSLESDIPMAWMRR